MYYSENVDRNTIVNYKTMKTNSNNNNIQEQQIRNILWKLAIIKAVDHIMPRPSYVLDVPKLKLN